MWNWIDDVIFVLLVPYFKWDTFYRIIQGSAVLLSYFSESRVENVLWFMFSILIQMYFSLKHYLKTGEDEE